MAQPHFIVFANEKGGTGKSTTAVHTAIALAASGHNVAALDLDSRQRTMTRYLENRDATMRRLEQGASAGPLSRSSKATVSKGSISPLRDLCEDVDVIVIDTPGRDDPIARAAILKADTLVTPMNDSFVDLDLIGQVHPENYKITKPSFYAELIWNSRTQRAKNTGKSVDWVVLSNRLQHIESHNLRRVGAALDELARRVGFRVIPGLGERVIYRELFPKGLTLLDYEQLGEVGIGHITARQELREMIAGPRRSPSPALRSRSQRQVEPARRLGHWRRHAEPSPCYLASSMTHTFDRTILREYDIRGIVGKTLHEADAYALGRTLRGARNGRRRDRASPSAATGGPTRPILAGGADPRPDRGRPQRRRHRRRAEPDALFRRRRRSACRAESRSPEATTRPITTASRCC